MTLVATSSLKTVAVLGGSYGGSWAAHVLANGLPSNWRVVLIDRNSHATHKYVLSRYSVVSGHEYKAFIPYTRLFRQMPPPTVIPPSRHLVLHATVKALNSRSVFLSQAFPELGISEPKVDFDYLIYALGSHDPKPINLWGDSTVINASNYRGTKAESIEWLKLAQKRIEDTESVLVVGGGALGIQFASDIADKYPNKKVTLLHSRDRFLPIYKHELHTEIKSAMKDLGVEIIFNERLDLTSLEDSQSSPGERTVRTTTGRELRAGLILLCTGQKPNTDLLQEAFPESVHADGPKKGLTKVTQALQIAKSTRSTTRDREHEETLVASHPNIFVIGDAADAFGAIKAGHTAYFQSAVAANNILKLIKHAQHPEQGPDELQLEKYQPSTPGIKVSVGLKKAVYQLDGAVGKMEDQPLDWNAPFMWTTYGYPEDLRDEDMLD